jgi:hypothetical protein
LKPPLTIEVTQDGNMVCALIGTNLQEGVAGFGYTVGEALRSLSAHVDSVGELDNCCHTCGALLVQESCLSCGTAKSPEQTLADPEDILPSIY